VTGAARELMRNAALVRHAAGVFELAVPASMGHLKDPGYADKLRAALEQHLGGRVALKISVGTVSGSTVAELETKQRAAQQDAAERAVHGDRFVRDLVDMFDAKVVGAKSRTQGSGD
jgi:DNA polymerase-3 subunit gamma/tau